MKRQVEDAISSMDSPAFLAVAGGDGTIRCAAGVVAGTELALLPIPAGTRNHFAKEVGIATLDEAAAAASGGTVTLIDIGEVNGEAFVNNANIGAYPRIVKERDAHVKVKRLSKQTATIVATWTQLRQLHKFNVTVDGGTTYRAWMVFVGNGRYGTSLFDVASRESLDDGLLDVRILRADGRLARVRVIGRMLLGRADRSPMAEFDEVRSIELAVDRAPGGHRAGRRDRLDGVTAAVPVPAEGVARADPADGGRGLRIVARWPRRSPSSSATTAAASPGSPPPSWCSSSTRRRVASCC